MKQPFFPRQTYTLNAPTIIDQDGKNPRSAAYDDMYFMPGCGFAEVDHVFLGGNGLPAAWSDRDHPYYPARASSADSGGTVTEGADSDGTFTIVELGFGTGLNIWRTVSLWLKGFPHSGRWRRLHIITTEQHPLPAAALAAYAGQHHLDEAFLTAFLRWYPENLRGQFRFRYRRGEATVIFDLLAGPAMAMLRQLRLPKRAFDALYLDGFAPSKNPELWSAALFKVLAAGSRPGHTRLATFTAARKVRDNLAAAGFAWQKVPGMAGKRHNTIGSLAAATWAEDEEQRQRALQGSRQILKAGAQVAVIGAGLAGCQVAHALSLRGFQVTVIDRAEQVAAGASGNHQGALYTRITKAPTAVSRFYLRAFHFARQQLGGLGPSALGGIYQPEPLRALLADDKALAAAHRLLAEQGFSPRQLSLEEQGGRSWLVHHLSAVIAPRALCERLLHHRIRRQLGTAVTALIPHQGGWRLRLSSNTTSDQELQADAVVIATSFDAVRLWPLSYCGLKAIRGQVTYLDERLLPRRQGILTADRYLLPPRQGIATAGASYNLHGHDSAIAASDLADNLAAAAYLAGRAIDPAAVVGGRVSFRGASKDYLPLVGPVPDTAAFEQAFGYLRRDAKKPVDLSQAGYVPGLYVSLGHGSRGLTSTGLSGEVLAALMAGEPGPAEAAVLSSLAPERFVLRALKRGESLAADRPRADT